MKRDIYKQLLQWKNGENNKPLILQGARQVGKTYILNEFGKKEYKSVAYFNFEEEPDINKFFKDSLNPKKILEKLSIYHEKKIVSEETLIFFDEIQESPRTITSLKYFNEAKEKYNIVAAGSLLGVKLGQNAPFPVGKVSYLELYPFSFGEFLDGIGRTKLRQLLNGVTQLKPIEDVFHKELLEKLKMYFYIGGMPAAIRQYNTDQDFNNVRKIQNDLLKDFENDFRKHTSESDTIKLTNTWKIIPNQLARENKKFKFAEISKNARAREYNEIITWLNNAGLVIKSYNISHPKLPLSGYKRENIFKFFLLDVGLLGAMLNLSAKTIIEGNTLFSEYNGAFTENYVAQELVANGFKYLYYWTSHRTAEIDFIISYEDIIYPLEVKSGSIIQSKSLKVYKEKYKDSILSRTSLKNFKHDGYIHNFPLYAISHFPKLTWIKSG